ncbi:ATP-binding cassette domain-containing protein [Corynebacterium sp. 321]|uniref:ATP-binding cassette domain-containing protein n=1 Tax=Corynebacterium sp. 321 TaxID=2651047 RepID=UPI0013011C22|nr:ATP-binding cassette domain-containing protein [Corynebacterium sp. 321]KAB1550687.1 ATP-binding cassette domain-containing protein [Corynebacterium sp. 321]
MPITTYIWGDSGSGLSERAWDIAERTGAAWVGNNAQSHISMMRSTVRDELTVAMEQRGVPVPTMEAAVDAALVQWGLTEQAYQDPMSLSTGQTRRVAIAQALLAGPTALVLDCPCDGLDTDAVTLLRDVLMDFPGEVTVVDRVRNALADSAQHVEHITGAHEPPPRIDELVTSSLRVDDKPTPSLATPQAAFTATELVTERGHSTIGPVSVTAPAGAITHVAGPNGCGKTTLFLAGLGLVPKKQLVHGTLECAGRIGWCPTDMDSAVTRKSVREELELGSSAELARAAMDFAQLTDIAEVHPLDLPSARRRIVLVAAAMVRAPGVVFLDEPTVGLDAPGAAALADLVRRYVAGEYHANIGRDGETPAIVWSCHDPHYAAAVSDYSVQIAPQR